MSVAPAPHGTRILAALGLVILSACGSGNPSRLAGSADTPSSAASQAPRTVHVAEQDFALAPDSTTLAGPATVAVNNAGPSNHELLAFRTDLAENALPLGPDGRVIEDGPGVTKVLDTETDLTPGTHRTLKAPLPPGRYVLICNLQNHYQLGMHVVITVTG